MINKLKLGLFLGSAMLAAFGLANSAGAQALVFNSITNIDIGGKIYTIDAGGGATTVVVGASSATITVPAASTVVFASRDRYALDNDGSLTTTCTDVTSYITITGAATVVVTPDTADVCGGGGGGGGGGGTTKPKTPATPAATPAVPANEEAPADCLAGYQFSPSTGRNCNAAAPAIPAGCAGTFAFSPVNGQKCPMVSSTTTTTTNTTVVLPGKAQPSGYAFGLTLVKQGVRGEACKAWQNFFNVHRGAGLVADGICGPKSMAAARAWQASVGLVADGVLGPMSRAKANAQASMGGQ